MRALTWSLAVTTLLLTAPASADEPALTPASISAHEPATPVMHPAIPLLDEAGVVLTAEDDVLSASRTCGACHDAAYIESHSSHRDKGISESCVGCHIPGGEEALLAAARDGQGRSLLRMAPPDNPACGRCHGLVAKPDTRVELGDGLRSGDEAGSFGQTLRTGEVFAAQQMGDSLLNLADKGNLERPWDVHASRGLTCATCHFAANNPVRAGLARRHDLPYLESDPRTLSLAEFLARPDHRLRSAGCTDCHDAAAAHKTLQYRERHLAALACQACHVPSLRAPALRSADHTVVTPDGGPRLTFRGVRETEFRAPNTWFIDSYRPFLLAEEHDGLERFAPYNLVVRWGWVQGADDTPVPDDLVRRAWLDEDGSYVPELVAVLDRNGDARLEASELLLDSDTKVAAVGARLAALGVTDAHIRGEVAAHAVRHGIAGPHAVTASCATCHDERSRLDEPIVLATGPLPGGVAPVPSATTAQLLGGRSLEITGDTLQVARRGATPGRYVMGHSRQRWSNTLGFLLFVLTVLGVAVHAGLRYAASRRRGPAVHAALVQHLYMYGTYERVWHWTMAVGVVVLLLTGLQISTPELGLLLFPTAVFAHNIMAVVLIVNAFLSLFYHVATGEIRQFVPERAGLTQRLVAQVLYYTKGIFAGAVHPMTKHPQRKLNPLQQVTYAALLNILFPLQVITGVALWVGGYDPELLRPVGGLTWVAPLHNLGSWLFASFLVMHVYLTTTGHTLLSNLRAMVDGWDDVEAPPELAGEQGARS